MFGTWNLFLNYLSKLKGLAGRPWWSIASIYCIQNKWKVEWGNSEVSSVELLNIAHLKSLFSFLYRLVHVCGKAAGQKPAGGMNWISLTSWSSSDKLIWILSLEIAVCSSREDWNWHMYWMDFVKICIYSNKCCYLSYIREERGIF